MPLIDPSCTQVPTKVRRQLIDAMLHIALSRSRLPSLILPRCIHLQPQYESRAVAGRTIQRVQHVNVFSRAVPANASQCQPLRSCRCSALP